MNFGPGYRAYFGRFENEIVVLLTGGSKRRQSADIKEAKALWAEYLERQGERDEEPVERRDDDNRKTPGGDS